MAKKKGPPYEDDPECQYVVVDKPWPDNLAGKARNANNGVFFHKVAYWLSLMLHPRVWPEELYYVSTRADVIAKYPQGVDISPILGEHNWRNFFTLGNAVDKRSYIFPYNYRRLGHPAEHNWATHIPAGDPPPNFLPMGIRQPYPRAMYAEHTLKSCTSLALPMPMPNPIDKKDEDEKQATPPLEEPQQERPAHYALAHQLPDEPPEPMAPPESMMPPEEEQEEEQELPQRPSRLFVSKLDPYDEEEAATGFLKAEAQDAVLPPVKAEPKVEEGMPHPSPALVDALRQYENMQNQELGGFQGDRAVLKKEPGAEAYQASAALIAAIEQHEAQLARDRVEEARARMTSQEARRTNGATVKPEPRHGMMPLTSLARGSTSGASCFEPEAQDVPLPPPAASRDPRSRDPKLTSSSLSTKRAKKEDEDVRPGYDTKRARY